MGWGAYFVRLIINSIAAAVILFGVAVFAMNRYMVTVHSSVDGLTRSVEALNTTVARVDSDLTASVERLNNNVSRIDRELTSLQGKSGRLAAALSQIESGTSEPQPEAPQTQSEDNSAQTVETPEAAGADATDSPVVAATPAPQTTQTLPIPTSRPDL